MAVADMQALSPRSTELGGFTIRRLLPQRPRRMVGAWCFLARPVPANPMS